MNKLILVIITAVFSFGSISCEERSKNDDDSNGMERREDQECKQCMKERCRKW